MKNLVYTLMKKTFFFTNKQIVLGAFLLIISLKSVAQTQVTVVMHDGSEQKFSVSENGKLYFDETNLFIDEESGNTESIRLELIRKLLFSSSGTVLPVPCKQDAAVYPNPAQDFIQVAAGINEKLSISLFSLTGKVLLTGNYMSGEKIDVKFLPKGFYLIRINNVTVKFTKL